MLHHSHRDWCSVDMLGWCLRACRILSYMYFPYTCTCTHEHHVRTKPPLLLTDASVTTATSLHDSMSLRSPCRPPWLLHVLLAS